MCLLRILSFFNSMENYNHLPSNGRQGRKEEGKERGRERGGERGREGEIKADILPISYLQGLAL